MNGRVTLAMLAVAVAAAVYVFGFAIPRQTEQEATDAREKKLIAFTPDEIVRLELPLSEPAGGHAKLVREPGSKDWRIESPRAVRADSFTVEGILEALGQLQVELTIDEPPADRAQFGLGDAAARVEIAAQSGEPFRLVLGGDAPVGSLRYVEASTRPGVVLGVTSAMLGELTPDLERLRDKSLITLDPKDVKQVQVELSGKPFVVAQRSAVVEAAPKPEKTPDISIVSEAGSWELTQPIADKADGDRIFRFLQDVRLARADAFVDEPEKLSQYGLEKPEARVRLLREGEAGVELAFGRSKDKVYARVDGQGPLLEIPARILDTLPRKLFDYRDKRVFEVEALEVERIELEFPRDAKSYAFERKGELWEPEAADVKIQNFRVGDLLYELDRVDATALIEGKPDLAALGLDPPLVRVSVLGAEKKPIGWLALGETTTGQGTAARSSSSDRVWRVVADIGEKIPLGLASFRSTWIAPETPPEAAPAPAAGDAVPPPPTPN